MRHTILVLAFALVAGSTQARADMVYYNMTGTITSVQVSPSSPSASYAVGDHISWTLQYDRSTPLASSSEYYSGYQNLYMMKAAVITNIVDQTNGYHVLMPSMGGSLELYGDSKKYWSYLSAGESYQPPENLAPNYDTDLFLRYKGSFPTLNLSNLQLNSVPIIFSKSDFSYFVQWADPMPGDVGYGFNASVNSISAPVYGAPEPASLTLFLFGAAGFAALGIRRRLRLRLVSFLAIATVG